MEELGFNISDSAIFNVLKRHNLSTKDQRLIFSQKKESKIIRAIPPLAKLKSGECWIFWITELGKYNNIDNLYIYNFLDLKSKIACSRLYKEISYDNFEDTFTSVALSVATTLDLKLSYLCFFKESKILSRYRNILRSKISKTIKTHGRDIKINILTENDELQEIIKLRDEYTTKSVSELMPAIIKEQPTCNIKSILQGYIRTYNLNNKIELGDEIITPIEYHNKLTNSKLILPLWAYIERDY